MAPATPLLEREREVALLEASIEQALGGHGGALTVEGPAGIGKTSLLSAARCRGAEQGMAVASAQGAALERDFGFGVVRQLFEVTVAGADTRVRRRLLAGAAELAARIVAPTDVAPDAAPVQQPAIVHGLYWLTSNLAEVSPLLLTVDDLQWCDAPSLEYLAYLARRVEGMPVLVVVAVRTGDPLVDESIVAELVADDAVRTVRPEPLSIDGVDVLVRDRLRGDADRVFIEACHGVTRGVPFLVHELLIALEADRVLPTADAAARIGETGPSTVAHATALRLSRVAPPAVEVARAIAVLGPHTRVDRVAALAGVDEHEVRTATDALIGMDILVSGPPLGFVHPLVHRAVYDDMSVSQRADDHARAARLLAAENAPLDQVAAHLLLTDPAGRVDVVEILRDAARSALERGAPASAVAYLQRAVDEGTTTSRAELLRELGEAEALASDPGAIRHLEEAFRLHDDPVARARISYRLAELDALAGDWTGCIQRIDAAVDELGDRDPDLAARFEAGRASTESYDPRFATEFERRLPRLRELLEQPVPGARNLALRVAGAMANRWTDHHEVIPLVERGLDDGRFLRDEGIESMDLVQGVVALVSIDELDRAEAATAEAFDDARRRGSLPGYAVSCWYRGWIDVQRGDLRTAEPDYRAAIEVAAQNGWTLPLITFVFMGVDVLMERPQLDDLARLAETTELASPLAESAAGAFLLTARGRLRASRGERDAAVEDLARAGAMLDSMRLRNPIVYLWRSPLALALPAEAAAEARELVDEELRIATDSGLERCQGVALRALGLLEGGPRGIELLEESLRVLEACPSSLEPARTLVELGATKRRQGQRLAGRDVLREGLERAQQCGAQRLEERALQELRLTGARPRRRAVSGPESLTAGEERVARMAADGLANREIAQALFVTIKAVENQLTAVYRKLGVRRDRLAAALQESPARS